MPFPSVRPVLTVLYLVAGVIAVTASPSSAQESGLSFLRIGTDAAALARGDAGVASTDNAFATYWNPAALAAGPGHSLAISNHLWIADVRTYALAGSYRPGLKWGVGAFVTATGSGDLEARDRPGEPTGVFNAQFIATGVGAARDLGPLRAGVVLKFLSERIFTDSAEGYAFDFGLHADLADGAIRLGAAWQNLGSMEDLSAQATELPELLRLGAEIFPFRIIADLDGTPLLTASIVTEYSRDMVGDESRLHVGLSSEVLETLVVRAGYLTNDELRDFSAGMGLTISSLQFDYTLLPFESGFGGPAHILTLSYAW
ncbi:MAG: PorV/PorQ family protein [Rhodothermales bacterium]|nr:PorV/PorQ family protein [Rhodothermales bacterium]